MIFHATAMEFNQWCTSLSLIRPAKHIVSLKVIVQHTTMTSGHQW